MTNPILDFLTKNNASQPTSIQSVYNTIMGSGNPSAYVQKMAQTNPSYKQAMDLVNQCGGDVKQAAMNYAAQNGIDINSLMNQIRR